MKCATMAIFSVSERLPPKKVRRNADAINQKKIKNYESKTLSRHKKEVP